MKGSAYTRVGLYASIYGTHSNADNACINRIYVFNFLKCEIEMKNDRNETVDKMLEEKKKVSRISKFVWSNKKFWKESIKQLSGKIIRREKYSHFPTEIFSSNNIFRSNLFSWKNVAHGYCCCWTYFFNYLDNVLSKRGLTFSSRTFA